MAPDAIRTLIVDDEPIARQVLLEELAGFPEITVVGEAENGQDALNKIDKLNPDLVFLDLQMPAASGFDVVRGMEGAYAPVVVIVTAYDQHAIEAFEAGAIDYLLKPVSEARLRKAVERAKSLLTRPVEAAQRLARIAAVGNAAFAVCTRARQRDPGQSIPGLDHPSDPGNGVCFSSSITTSSPVLGGGWTSCSPLVMNAHSPLVSWPSSLKR